MDKNENRQQLVNEEESKRNLEIASLGEQIAGLGYFERNWKTGKGYWSKGFYKLLGIKPEDLDCTHEDLMKFVHKDDVKRVAHHINRSLKEQSAMDIEFRIVQADGNIIDIHGIGNSFFDGKGKPVNTIGAFRDISETKNLLSEKQERIDEISFLNRILLSAQKTESLDGICEIIAKEVSGFNPNSIVAVSLFDNDLGGVRIRAIEGVGKKYQQFAKILGNDPKKMVFDAKQLDKTYEHYTTGSLIKVAGGLSELMKGHLPEFVCRNAEKLMSVTSLHTAGFKDSGMAKGGIVILMRNNKSLPNPKLIEAALGYLSELLKRRLAENELKSAYLQLQANEQQLQASNQQLAASEQQLRATNQQLAASEQQLKANETELITKNYELQERLKEISCLYSVSSFIEKYEEVEEILKNTVEVLPPAWHYTEDAVARITFKDKSYTSQNFKETQWKLATDIIVNNGKHGSIEVYYLNEKPALDEGSFLKEERFLIDSLSQLLGRAIENIQKNEEILNANQQLKASEQQLIAANEQLTAGDQQLRATNQQLLSNEQELREAKEQAEESEEKYRLLSENSSDCIWAMDNQFNFIYLSAALEQMTGFKPEEWEGTFLGSHFTKKEFGRVGAIASKHIENRKTEKHARFETKMLNKANEEFDVEISSTILLNDKDDFIGMQGITRNITERKKAEETLRNRDARHLAMIENIGDVIAILEPDGITKYQSPNIEKWFGWKSEERIAKNGLDLVHPQDLSRVQQELLNILSKETSSTIEFRLKCKNGIYKWIELTATNHLFNPAIDGVLINYHDITERKQAEEALKESEEKYRSIFENSALGIFRSTSEGRYEEVNKAFAKILGFNSPKTMVDEVKHIGTLYKYPKDREKIIKEFAEKGFVEDYEILANHPHKEKVWISINAKQQKHPDGTVYYEGTIKDITERKQAEEDLKVSLIKYKTLFDTLPLGVTISDDTGRIVESNKVAEKLLGLELDEYKKRKIDSNSWQIIRPDYTLMQPDEFASVRALKENRLIENVQMGIVKENNEITWINVSAIPLPLNSRGVLIAYNDITEKIEAEHANLKTLERLNFAMDTANEGFWEWDLSTNKITFDELGLKMLGHDPDFEPIDTQIWLDKIHPDHKNIIIQAFDAYISGKKSKYNVEFPIQKKDGSYIWVSSIAKVFKNDSNGKPLLVIGIHNDITNRIEHQQALRESEQRFDLAMKASQDGIFDWNLVTNEIYYSPGWKSMLGYEYDEIPNDFSIWETNTDPEDVKRSWAMQQEVINKKRDRFEMEFKMKHKDGHWVDILSRAEAVFDENGKAVRVIGTHVDITERKQTEKELIAAKEKAEESDRLKSAFLANMSHEIRTPMNGILGFTDLIKNPDLNSDQRNRFIEIIRKSGDRMLNTVNDIIEISKIEAGLAEVKKTEIDMSVRLRILLDFFQPQAQEKGLILSFESELTNLLIHTDKSKFESILTNLIKNAIKFTEIGKIEVSYFINDGLVQFCVKDTGIGIPENRIDAVFNRFEQADIADSRAFQGSGLGLAIAKSYVEMLGGKIWVESVEGKGSAFYFTIPCLSESIKPALKTRDNKAENNEKPLSQPKILIVEDDAVSADFLQIILNNTATTIILADSGKMAIELCKIHTDIDVILMDIKMPGIDGIEATRRIREFNKEVIIIAQSAYALTGDREKALEAGCDDYITKPIKKELLIKIIQKHFA